MTRKDYERDSFSAAAINRRPLRDRVWNWAARHLLSEPARAEYGRVTAAAWAEHERVWAAARVEYERVWAAGRAEYGRVTARTFAKLYNEDKS